MYIHVYISLSLYIYIYSDGGLNPPLWGEPPPIEAIAEVLCWRHLRMCAFRKWGCV